MKVLSSPLSIVLEYYSNWTNKDFLAASNLVSEDVKFEMPINRYETKAKYMEAVAFTAINASSFCLLSSFGDEQEAILLYEFNFGPIENFRIVEHFVVKDGRIVLIRHIHDTYLIRKLIMGE